MPVPRTATDRRRPQLFLPSDLLHSRDLSSVLGESSSEKTREVIVVHKDRTSFYKSTRKVRRTAERLLSACCSSSCGEDDGAGEGCAVCGGYLVGSEQASLPSDGQKECEAMHKRLSSEFGAESSVSIDVPNVVVSEYRSKEGDDACAQDRRVSVIFFDLQAIDTSSDVSDAKGQCNLMQRVLSLISQESAKGDTNLIVHVRSEALHRSIVSVKAASSNQGLRCIDGAEFDHLLSKSDEGETGGCSPIRRLRNKKGAANCPLTIYPARYVELPISGNDGEEAIERAEICRFHNYDERGCLRSQKAKKNPEVKGCEMDHDHCFQCGRGHRALECPETGDEDVHLSSVVFRRTPSGDIISVPFCENDAIHRASADSLPLPALLVLGGRLRGRTLATCEMLPLSRLATGGGQQWMALPNLHEHRGSHAACSPPGSGVAFVLGGGTADGNSDTTEMLYFGRISESQSEWQWATVEGRLSSPRHAFEAVTCVVSEQTKEEGVVKSASVFAVGGWKYGSQSCESVERLTCDYPTDKSKRTVDLQSLQKQSRWEECAPLRLPRRLHSVVATTDGSAIYVFGGYVDERRTTPSIERYDVEMNRWSAVDDLPFGEHNCPLVQAVAERASFLIFPFSTHAGEAPLVQRYTPGSDNPFAPVIVPGNDEQLRLPIANWHSFSATSSPSMNKAFLIGGTVNGKWTDRSFELDLLRLEWNELPPMTFARRRLAAVVLE